MRKLPFDKHSMIFAPMEGVTDGPYREAIQRAFGDWDYYSTDFYRIPSVGNVHTKTLVKHYGEEYLKKKSHSIKTAYQFLTSEISQTKQAINLISELNYHHIDLNLGCPSKKVNSNKGGAYLLSDLKALEKIIRDIRESFQNVFTVKIRIGYRDDSLFFDLLNLFEDCGVDGITIHARTRDQLYKGVADWSYIEKAVKHSSLPIIANGDIWTIEDIDRIYDQCDPYAIMCGRSALKTPWLASIYKEYQGRADFISEEFLLKLRAQNLDLYFYELEKEYRKFGYPESTILKRFKAFCRYLFDDYENFELIRGKFLRSQELREFKDHLVQFVHRYS
ncbi:tRNA-dihydrouridine synthase [Halobacteriovorax sp. BALOs_7]|uniref:tRNA dihydrouridine synthase n=1 Tax=Halobacteriovorax sp. BALOs_7 TaxID=2109558 RepID=UPI000EA10DCC|nr:tRNA-dihydrouridine synthase family protein [Halobacteriovorax sp. BALOs_7]